MMTTPTTKPDFRITVLLVDDQAFIAEAVRRMLADQLDIDFHACTDPAQAIPTANRVTPTVILQDLVMPGVDGLTLVRFYRANPTTKDTPLIVLSTKEEATVKAECFAQGANDYLVKLPDKIELIARIRYHSKGYINLLERNQAYAEIARRESQLTRQIGAATKYVRSLLPQPTDKPAKITWSFVPSTNLGGDTFGYHWLDDDHFAMYLLDVTGHGLDSALYSVTVMNVLRSRSLPNTDFRNPSQVLAAANDVFQMEQYGDKFFSIWYGVYQQSTRTLRWANGGHPDGLLFDPRGNLERLDSTGPVIGMMPWEFETRSNVIEAGSKLYIYSDGCQEIIRPDGTMWTLDEFIGFMGQSAPPNESKLDELLNYVRELRGSQSLDDDFSAFEAVF